MEKQTGIVIFLCGNSSTCQKISNLSSVTIMCDSPIRLVIDEKFATNHTDICTYVMLDSVI